MSWEWAAINVRTSPLIVVMLTLSACVNEGSYPEVPPEGAGSRVVLPAECRNQDVKPFCTEIETLPTVILEPGFTLNAKPIVTLLEDGRLRYSVNMRDDFGEPGGTREDFETSLEYHGWTAMQQDDPLTLRYQGTGRIGIDYLLVIRLKETEGFVSSGEKVTRTAIDATLETVQPVTGR